MAAEQVALSSSKAKFLILSVSMDSIRLTDLFCSPEMRQTSESGPVLNPSCTAAYPLLGIYDTAVDLEAPRKYWAPASQISLKRALLNAPSCIRRIICSARRHRSLTADPGLVIGSVVSGLATQLTLRGTLASAA